MMLIENQNQRNRVTALPVTNAVVSLYFPCTHKHNEPFSLQKGKRTSQVNNREIVSDILL